ncbi:hypothetical protein D3C74_310220 [compost metagenome]
MVGRGERRSPGEALDRVRLAVDLEVPVAAAAHDLHGARTRVRHGHVRVARVHVVGVGRVDGIDRIDGAGARRAEDLELPQGAPVARGALRREEPDVAAGARDGERLVTAGRALRRVDVGPGRGVVRDLDLVRLGVRRLPLELDALDRRALLEVDLDPLGIRPGAGPARAGVAVDCCRGGRVVGVLDRRRGGRLALGQQGRGRLGGSDGYQGRGRDEERQGERGQAAPPPVLRSGRGVRGSHVLPLGGDRSPGRRRQAPGVSSSSSWIHPGERSHPNSEYSGVRQGCQGNGSHVRAAGVKFPESARVLEGSRKRVIASLPGVGVSAEAGKALSHQC